jgi:release factor glutamine methyltransferase
MHPVEPTSQTLRAYLTAMADRLADDGVADPPPSAELIAACVLGLPRDRLDAQADRPPTAEEQARLRDLVDRVAGREPAAYALGCAMFLGRVFEVTRETLIPRRDTEELVRIALRDLRSRPLPERLRLLELGTGSGCVAITLVLELPGTTAVATDISAASLDVARRNLVRHGAADRVALAQGDLFEPVARLAADRPFDVIISNPPYIPSGRIGALGRAVAGHEPHLALDGGADGLDFHRRILAEAPRFLVPDGRVFLEHESDEGELARRIGEQAEGFEEVRVLRDARGLDRVLTARRRPSARELHTESHGHPHADKRLGPHPVRGDAARTGLPGLPADSDPARGRRP